jgi:predicted aconitase
MYHIVGVTPEAWTAEAAFQGGKPEETFVYGKKERKEVFEELSIAMDSKVDLVAIGCPHCTLQELADIARLLVGKKVHKDVRLWVGTNALTRLLAERKGIVNIIEGAGGFVTADMCPLGFNIWHWMGIRVGATNSCAPGDVKRMGRGAFWFGTTDDCIKAAITGRWEGI